MITRSKLHIPDNFRFFQIAIGGTQIHIVCLTLSSGLNIKFHGGQEILTAAGPGHAHCMLRSINAQLKAFVMTTNNTLYVRDLKIGFKFEKNAFDDNNVMLVRAGTKITDELLDQLRIRGVRKLKLSNLRKWSPQRTEADFIEEEQATLEPTACSERIISLDHLADAASFNKPDRIRETAPTSQLKLPELREQINAGTKQFQVTVDQYANMMTGLIEGKHTDTDAAKDLIGRFHKILDLDPSLGFLIADMKSNPSEYIFQHGLNMALVTMSTAHYMGYAPQQVIDAGVAALFSDVGMLRVPEEIRFANRKLTQGEWLQVEQHPIHTANILEQISSITQHTLLAAYQSHERCDGSGYPRRRRQRNIHPLARIVGIADTYAAMTCHRPHRDNPNHPYLAMETILRDRTQLDRQVAKSFLDAMSLFPVGCEVKLSNGNRAKVIRSNGSQHTRPCVISITFDGTEADIEIDLAKDDTIDIVGIIEKINEPATTAA